MTAQKVKVNGKNSTEAITLMLADFRDHEYSRLKRHHGNQNFCERTGELCGHSRSISYDEKEIQELKVHLMKLAMLLGFSWGTIVLILLIVITMK